MGNYILIVILIVFSAFFSGSEIAYASASEIRLRRLSEEKNGFYDTAYSIYKAYDKALITILIGNNLVNIWSSSVAAMIAISLLGSEGTWVATLVMTVIIVTFGEIMPKIIASSNPERFSFFAAFPLRLLMTVTFPVVWCVSRFMDGVSKIWEKQISDDSVTEDDIETMLETAEDEGVVDEDTHDLLQSALTFDDVLAYEVITPRVDMFAIDVDDDKESIFREIMDMPYSRIPVYEETIDNIIGFIHLNTCMKQLASGAELNIREMLLPAVFVHKTTPLPEVLSLMRQKKCHVVIVTDEYGGTMGMLTMEDVLEQLVGDIWDESDEISEEFKELSPDTFLVDGDMRIYDFFEETDIDDRDFDDDNATVGGWAIEMLGEYPHAGDSFEFKNLTLTVNKVRNMRILSLIVRVHEISDEEDE